MASSTKHWGEIESVDSEECITRDVSADIEKSMNKFCLAEFDTDQGEVLKLDELNLNAMDPLMLYAISLHKYANDMTEKIRVAELAVESNVLPLIDAVTPVPELATHSRKHVRNSLNYIKTEFNNPTLKQEVEIPEISDAVAKQILVKCVAVLFAQISFETTHQSVLDLMTDVLEDIVKKICHKLKVACEDELNNESTGFPNAIERVFVDVGLGGIKGLHDYYETRVVKYVNVLYKRCQDLNSRYKMLLKPNATPKSELMSKMTRTHIKSEDDIDENPEMHFENGDLGTSSFETGFELLNSLEQGANLEEAEINVVAGTSSAELAEIDTSSPLNKRKRHANPFNK